MSRKPRCIPPLALVEITARTIGGRYFLRPSDKVNEIIGGILARYARIHEMPIVFWVVPSNHHHGLLIPRDADHLAAFMRDVQSQIAKEIGLEIEWDQRFWGRRYDAIPVADEEESQVERLAYLCSQSVKENLCETVAEWPGIHAAQNIASGEPIQGVWRDRTLEGRQSRGQVKPNSSLFLHEEELVLTKLPCWSELSDEEYRERVGEIVQRVEQEAAGKRRLEGKSCLGIQKILNQDPLASPKKPAKSPRPWFHAVSKKAREVMYESFKAFLDAYRLASAGFLEGKEDVVFPDGCFPPARPFFAGARAGPIIADFAVL